MRPLVFILLLISCGVARAQVQERKLVDRIMQPDMTLANPMQGKAYHEGGTGLDINKGATVKEFYFVQKFSSKGFDTKRFDTSDFWKGDFQFDTKPANVKADSAADKTFSTKTVAVKDAREAGKTFDGNHTVATREAPVQGKTSQNHLEEEHKGKGGEMNIDQVRDLLNKPKL